MRFPRFTPRNWLPVATVAAALVVGINAWQWHHPPHPVARPVPQDAVLARRLPGLTPGHPTLGAAVDALRAAGLTVKVQWTPPKDLDQKVRPDVPVNVSLADPTLRELMESVKHQIGREYFAYWVEPDGTVMVSNYDGESPTFTARLHDCRDLFDSAARFSAHFAPASNPTSGRGLIRTLRDVVEPGTTEYRYHGLGNGDTYGYGMSDGRLIVTLPPAPQRKVEFLLAALRAAGRGEAK